MHVSKPSPRLTLFATLLTSLVLFGADNAAAEADGPDFWSVQGVAADDVLKLRAEASPHADKLAGIPPGAGCLKNLGCVGGLSLEEFTTLSKKEQAKKEQAAQKRKHPRWCQIEYQGQRGWVAGRYLREGSCDQAYGRAGD